MAKKYDPFSDYDRVMAQAEGGLDSTSVALPDFRERPKLDVGRVPKQALAAMAGVQSAIPTLPGMTSFPTTGSPTSQLRASAAALDAVPNTAAMAADIATGGNLAAGAGAAAATQPLREGGYRLLGQDQMFTGGWRGTVARSAGAGAGQLALGAVGRGVTGAIGHMAEATPHHLAALAMRTPKGKAEMIGDVGETFLNERVPIGHAGRFTGTAKIRQRLNASLAEEDKVAQKLHDAQFGNPGQSGGLGTGSFTNKTGIKVNGIPRIKVSDLADRAYNKILKRMGRGLKDSEIAELQRLRAETIAEHGRSSDASYFMPDAEELPMSVKDALQFKRVYDNRSLPVYTKLASDRPANITALEQHYVKALADESRDWLRTTVPQLGAQMDRTQKLLMLRKAMGQAEGDFGVPTSPLHAVTSREALSRGALKAQKEAPRYTNRAAKAIQRNAPRAVAGQMLTPRAE